MLITTSQKSNRTICTLGFRTLALEEYADDLREILKKLRRRLH